MLEGPEREEIAEAESSAQHSEPLLVLTSPCFTCRDEVGKAADAPNCPARAPLPAAELLHRIFMFANTKGPAEPWICESPGLWLGGILSEKSSSIAAKRSCDLCWERAKHFPGTERDAPSQAGEAEPFGRTGVGDQPKKPWLRAPAHPRALGRQQQDLGRAGRGGGGGGGWKWIQAAAEPF